MESSQLMAFLVIVGASMFSWSSDFKLPPAPNTPKLSKHLASITPAFRVDDVIVDEWEIKFESVPQKTSWGGSNTALKGKTSIKAVPENVIKTAKQYAICGVEPAVFLAIAWHERAGKKGWYDDYIFGYGAFDHGNWGQRYRGWENQWAYASIKICKYFNGRSVDVQNFQSFAKNIYKTTDWENYRNAYGYYLTFKGQVQ